MYRNKYISRLLLPTLAICGWLFVEYSVPNIVYALSCTFTESTVDSTLKVPLEIHTIDIDGDSDLDIVSYHGSTDRKVVWHENDGSESFTLHVIDTLPINNDGEVSSVDLDGDGDIDIIVAETLSKEIRWYENDGSETFSGSTIGISADDLNDIIAIDLDEDGDIDVVASAQDVTEWYDNDGSESFTKRSISTGNDGILNIFVIDMDGDSDLDVISSGVGDNSIDWYDNNGSEVFTKKNISTTPDNPRVVFAIDLDGDGDIDVLNAAIGDDTIDWYQNDGSESFTKSTIVSSTNNAWDIHAIDVDSDGDIDIVSSSRGNNTVDWYDNDGSESFTKREITSSFGGRSVYAVDIDGDSDTDIIASDDDNGKISLFSNAGACVDDTPTTNTSSHASRTMQALQARLLSRRADLKTTFLGQSITENMERIAITVRVENTGPDEAEQIRVSHSIEPKLKFEAGLTDDHCIEQGSDGVVCSIGQLAVEESAEFTLYYIVPSAIDEYPSLHHNIEATSIVGDENQENNLVTVNESLAFPMQVHTKTLSYVASEPPKMFRRLRRVMRMLTLPTALLVTGSPAEAIEEEKEKEVLLEANPLCNRLTKRTHTYAASVRERVFDRINTQWDISCSIE